MENQALLLILKDSTSSFHVTEWIAAMDLLLPSPGLTLKVLTFPDNQL